MMDPALDTSITEAMILATIQAENCHSSAMLSNDWHAKLEDMVVHLSSPSKDVDSGGLSMSAKSRKGKQKLVQQKDFWQKKNADFETSNGYNKNTKPVKTSSPLAAIKLDSIFLTDHIESLQNLALIGRWHFPHMDDSEM